MASKNERSKWEITMDLLKITLEEKNAKKTRIQQKAYLDWKNFQRYFDYLLTGGFISKNSGNESYMITDKGKDLLRKLKEVDAVLGFKRESPKIFISNQDWIRQAHESASKPTPVEPAPPAAGLSRPAPSPAAKAANDALEAVKAEVEQERNARAKAEQVEAEGVLVEAKKAMAAEAKPAVPPTPPPPNVGAPTQELPRPTFRLTVLNVLVSHIGAPGVMTFILSPEEAFLVQARFQLQGPEVPSLATQEPSYEMKVYAKEMISGRSKLLATHSAKLVKEVLEYTVQMQTLGLSTGLYRLTTLVILHPPINMAGYYEGPIVQVAGVQPTFHHATPR